MKEYWNRFSSKIADNIRFWQEATSHWRRDIKTSALHEINLKTAKQNNYSSHNQAIISSKRVEIVKAEETMPGIFIGNCLVKPKKSTCPIINITEKQVVILTSLVTIEELSEDVMLDTTEKHMVQVMQRKDKELMQARKSV